MGFNKSLIVLGLVFSISANASSVQRLVTVSADNGMSAAVNILSNDGAASGMSVVTDKGNKDYSLEEITKGVVLFQKDSYKVLFLSGAVESRSQEGTFTMKYLTNGLTGSYKTCQFLLRRDNSGWFVENIYTHEKPINNITVVTTKLGVKTLRGICPAGEGFRYR
jgi:hypothetical protein